MMQLSVNKPCHEAWDRMLHHEQGKFCGSCQKTVVDFSGMSDREIASVFQRQSSGICGRFTTDQLNRPIDDEPKEKKSWSYFWNILIATLITTQSANAQSRRIANRRPLVPARVQVESMKSITLGAPTVVLGDTVSVVCPGPIKIVVADGVNYQRVPFATIVNADGVGGAADDKGEFLLTRQVNRDSVTVEVSAVGYKPQLSTIASAEGTVTLYLERQPETIDTAVVTGTGGSQHHFLTGDVEVVETQTFSTKKIGQAVSALWKRVRPVQELALFPNPLQRGATFTVTVNLPKAGMYIFEIINPHAQVLFATSLSVSSKKHTQIFQAGSHWAAGMYTVRIYEKGSARLITSTLIIQ